MKYMRDEFNSNRNGNQRRRILSNFRCAALSCYLASQFPLLPYSLPHTIVLFPRFTSSSQSIHKEELPRITISSRFLLIFIRCLALEGSADREDCIV